MNHKSSSLSLKTPESKSLSNISTVVLCGGKGSRLGNLNKPLVPWKGKPLIEHVLAELPQTKTLFISANRDVQAYAKYGVVIKDSDTGLKSNSPLVGILSALTHMDTEWLLCTPGDTPLLKFGWEKSLIQALNTSSIICARDSLRIQPLHQLIHVSESPYLEEYLLKGHKSAIEYIRSRGATEVRYSQDDLFKNFNERDDFV